MHGLYSFFLTRQRSLFSLAFYVFWSWENMISFRLKGDDFEIIPNEKAWRYISWLLYELHPFSMLFYINTSLFDTLDCCSLLIRAQILRIMIIKKSLNLSKVSMFMTLCLRRFLELKLPWYMVIQLILLFSFLL